VLSHDVGVPLLHSQTCRTDALPCQDGLRLAFPLFIWPLLADIISPPSCLVTCLRATPLYSRVWPDDRPFLHCEYGGLPCSSSVYTSVHCIQNRAILSFQNTCTPGCGRTIVPSCSASTGSYCVLPMWIPLFPSCKTVLYCHQTSVFSKYLYLRVWPDDSSFLLCE
jgi:hypothetical protein